MMPTPLRDPLADSELVVEADTAAEALAEVGRRLGEDAEIVAAERVHRGGWRGFFAREVVQLTARPRGAAGRPGAPGPVPTVGVTAAAPADVPAGPRGLDEVLARMTSRVEEHERSFRDVLLRELAVSDPAPRPADPQPSSPPAVAAHPTTSPDVDRDPPAPPPPASVPEPTRPVRSPRPPAAGAVAWSAEGLRELRLPGGLIELCADLDPADDLAWVTTLAGGVSSWCRPLPTGDGVLIGPRANQLADGLELPCVRRGGTVPDGPVALRETDSGPGRAWVEDARGDRWGHLVVGGARWHGFLLDDLAAVSWVGDDELPAALVAASRLGLVLGYGLGTATGRGVVRATPVDVALAIRSLLPRA